MDLYIGTKIVKAELMDEMTAWEKGLVRGTPTSNHGGYKVVYEDGYESWSPQETFDRAYRLVTEAELRLLTKEPS